MVFEGTGTPSRTIKAVLSPVIDRNPLSVILGVASTAADVFAIERPETLPASACARLNDLPAVIWVGPTVAVAYPNSLGRLLIPNAVVTTTSERSPDVLSETFTDPSPGIIV